MKKIQFSFILLLAILLTGCVSSSTQSTSNEVQETSSNTQEQVIVEKEVPKETIYSMNEDVSVDYLKYKVTKVETFTEMGSSFLKKETNGKFVKVSLDILNNAKETKTIMTPRFRIHDSQERKYDRLSGDMMYIADPIEFGKQVQPGLSTSGAIIFEMPKDSEDLTLIISGDWLSISEVKVSLSDIKDIGKETSLKDKNDAAMDEAMADSQAQVDALMAQYS